MLQNSIIHTCTTPYGDYSVADTVYNGRPARVLYCGNPESAQSGIAQDDKPELLFDYNQRLIELLQGLQPQRVLLIGGGALTLPSAIQRLLPDAQLDVIELDAELIKIGEVFFRFKKGPHTTVYHMDGAQYLKTNVNTYDVILLDVFVGTTIPAVFQSHETAGLLQRALQSTGTVAMNIISSYHGERAGVLHRQIEAFESVLNHLSLFPAGFESSLWLPQNFILTAQVQKRDLQPFMRYQALTLP